MFKFFVFLFVFYISYVDGQTVVNRVRVKEHREYMINVIQEVVKTVEERGWSNLKLLDISTSVNETIFNRHYLGNLSYTNGFLVSLQKVDVLQSSLNQLWTVVGPADDRTTRVEIKGQLRMIDAALGYDIKADFEDGMKHYTGIITHPLLSFDFSVFKNANTHEMSVTVTGNQQVLNSRLLNILPRDTTSDALTTMFDRTSTLEGVRSWTEAFQTIALDVITNRIEFPGFCYNCPVT